MTKEEFLRNYYCTCDVQNQHGGNLVIISKAVRRENRSVVDGVKTTIDIQETNEWLGDSQFSSTPMDWNHLIDQTKRAHLDYFVQRAPIDDFYPLNSEENPDVSDMYR